MILTNYLIRKKIQALAVRAASRARRSLSLSDIRSMLILYEAEDHEAIQSVLQPLRKEGKRISTCVFGQADSGIAPDEANVVIREKGDLNLWGFPSDTLVREVCGMKADILINLSKSECYPLQYISLQHPCSFKAGIKYKEQGWYDLAISVTDKDDIRYLFEQILFYLLSIRAK